MSKSEHTAKIIGCNHLAICVDDLAKAKTFYGDTLGLEELERPEFVVAHFI